MWCVSSLLGAGGIKGGVDTKMLSIYEALLEHEFSFMNKDVRERTGVRGGRDVYGFLA